MRIAHLPATRRSSELSKHSAAVFAEAEDHPVTVTRRDGQSLVLMSQREADARAHLLELAAQLITVTSGEGGTLAKRMAAVFPWMLAMAQVASWKESATAIAAGLRGDAHSLHGDDVVDRP